MARDSTGKWVQRAGATGGGRTYRGQVPVNWYVALVVIVVVGLASVAFARYEYRSTAAASAGVAPVVGTTWYAGMAASICGTTMTALPASPSTDTAGITTTGGGVVKIAPKTSAQAGKHATLGQFVAGYAGLRLTATQIEYPGQKVYANGDKCASGTPDAGKTGVVIVEYWPHAIDSTEKGTVVKGDPASLKLGENSLFTLGFAPAGTALPRPSESVVAAVLQAASGASTSTTTTPTATTPTTAAPTSTTATTAATTTTTGVTPTTASHSSSSSTATTSTSTTK